MAPQEDSSFTPAPCLLVIRSAMAVLEGEQAIVEVKSRRPCASRLEGRGRAAAGAAAPLNWQCIQSLDIFPSLFP